jgi:hypothetical protein
MRGKEEDLHVPLVLAHAGLLQSLGNKNHLALLGRESLRAVILVQARVVWLVEPRGDTLAFEVSSADGLLHGFF